MAGSGLHTCRPYSGASATAATNASCWGTRERSLQLTWTRGPPSAAQPQGIKYVHTRGHTTPHTPFSCIRGDTTLHTPFSCIRGDTTLHTPFSCIRGHTTLHTPFSCIRGHTTLHTPFNCIRGHTTLHTPFSCIRGHTTLHTPFSCIRGHTTLHTPFSCIRGHTTLHTPFSCIRGDTTLHTPFSCITGLLVLQTIGIWNVATGQRLRTLRVSRTEPVMNLQWRQVCGSQPPPLHCSTHHLIPAESHSLLPWQQNQLL